MSQSDDPGSGSTPYGSSPQGPPAQGPAPQAPPPHGTTPYGRSGGEQEGRSPYGQPPQGDPSYGQPPYGQSPQGQPAYGQSPYGQPAYGQPPYAGQYGQPAYGAPAEYAQYGQYGYSAVPVRPGAVTTAAVIGFVFAAFGVLATLAVFLGGAALVGMAGAFDSASDDPFAGDLGRDAATGIGVGFVIVGLLALAWTVLMVWGSVWVLTGRSRVLLLVGGSIAVLVTLLGLLGSLFDSSTGPGTGSEYAVGIVLSLVFFVAALAIVVPLCLRPAVQYFAAHRARRGG